MDYRLFLLELKNILDMLQLENNELQGLKLQHDQKVSEFEKTQVEVLEVTSKAALPSANSVFLFERVWVFFYLI